MLVLLLIIACGPDDPKVYTKIVVGADGACALDERDNVHCWGRFAASAPSTQLDSISLQYLHVCGLLNGIGSCWAYGDDPLVSELTAVPEGEFLDVAAAYDGTCWLSTSGLITCYGRDESPDMEIWDGTPVTRITGGEDHYCGLTEGGVLGCWGGVGQMEAYGLLDAPIPGPFNQVDAGYRATCVIDTNNKLACWGGPDGEDNPLPNWTPEGHFQSVSTGDIFCALDAEGVALCRFPFACSKFLYKYTSISVGWWKQICATRETGGIDCWELQGEYGEEADCIAGEPAEIFSEEE